MPDYCCSPSWGI